MSGIKLASPLSDSKPEFASRFRLLENVAKSRDMTDISTRFLLPHTNPSTLQSSRLKYVELSSDPSQGLFIPTHLVPTAVKLCVLGLCSDRFAFGNKTLVQLEQKSVWTPEKP